MIVYMFTERDRSDKPWIVYRILGFILLILMVLAAFATSPYMGLGMVFVLILAALR